MRARRPFMILGGVLMVAVAVIAGYLLFSAGEEHTDDAQVTADMVPVAARVGGQVVHVAIIENQHVEAGALIAQIDDRDYAARLAQAQAELQVAQAQARAADAQVAIVEATSKGGLASAQAMFSGSSAAVSSAVAQIASARAAVARAEAEATRARRDLDRTRALRDANAATQQRLDDAQAADAAAQAALQGARAQLEAAQEGERAARARVSEARGRVTQSEPIDSQIDAARASANIAHARVEGAKAAVELATLQLSYTRIVAPTAGSASLLAVHEGQLVAPGQPVVRIVPVRTYVVANFKETQIGEMRPDQKAEIEIDALPGVKLEGHVESLSGGTGASFALLPADNATGNFVKVVQRVPVRIAWDNLPVDLTMRTGLSAEVTVHVGK